MRRSSPSPPRMSPRRVTRATTGDPVNGMINIAGPEKRGMDDFIRTQFAADWRCTPSGDRRRSPLLRCGARRSQHRSRRRREHDHLPHQLQRLAVLPRRAPSELQYHSECEGYGRPHIVDSTISPHAGRHSPSRAREPVAIRLLASRVNSPGRTDTRRSCPMPMLPTSEVPFDRARLTRRGFIAAGIAGGFALAACSQNPQPASSAGQNGRRDQRRRGGPAAQWTHRDRHLDPPADRHRPGWRRPPERWPSATPSRAR